MNTPIMFPNYFNLPDNQKLFVSDLPQNIKEDDLKFFFQNYNIVHITINRPQYDLHLKPITAIVSFSDPLEADRARIEMNMRKIKGRAVRISKLEKDNSQRYKIDNNIFIKNIPLSVSPRDVYEFFLQFGDIFSAKVQENEYGQHSGYGYINYENRASAEKAIEETNGKTIWGSTLEVNFFQKKNERENLPTATNIFLKDFPPNYEEKDLKTLLSNYGDVTSIFLQKDNGRKFAIVNFAKKEDADNALKNLNGKEVDGSLIYANTLQDKSERRKLLSHKIVESNMRLNNQFRNCNLYIKNIPYHATEQDLKDAFEQFGPVKSVKIEKYVLCTKINNEYVEKETSKGFGYVCFYDPNHAVAAKEHYNERYLPKYETWKYPLLVSMFMPKYERQSFIQSTQGTQPSTTFNPLMPNFNQPMIPMMNMKTPFVQPGINQGVPTNMMPQFNQQFNPMTQQPIYPTQIPTTTPTTTTTQVPQQLPKLQEPDYNVLNSFDDDYSKKEYLGEFIFKNIENHALSQKNNLTIDTIGKITGMILGIEDINEIIETCRDYELLTSRIVEAQELIGHEG